MEESIILNTTHALTEYTLQPPVLFSIPANYEDALIIRNKGFYVAMQRIEKKYKSLRVEISKYQEKRDIKFKQTHDRIESTRYLLNRFNKIRDVHATFRKVLK